MGKECHLKTPSTQRGSSSAHTHVAEMSERDRERERERERGREKKKTRYNNVVLYQLEDKYLSGRLVWSLKDRFLISNPLCG